MGKLSVGEGDSSGGMSLESDVCESASLIFSQTQTPLPQTIPLRVVRLLATHLASEHSFATLSNLNITSREIHDATLRDLYGTVYLNWSGNSISRKREEGWDVNWMAVEKWRKMRWDDRLEAAKGSSHIE
jgi:hypothetical protein